MDDLQATEESAFVQEDVVAVIKEVCWLSYHILAPQWLSPPAIPH